MLDTLIKLSYNNNKVGENRKGSWVVWDLNWISTCVLFATRNRERNGKIITWACTHFCTGKFSCPFCHRKKLKWVKHFPMIKHTGKLRTNQNAIFCNASSMANLNISWCDDDALVVKTSSFCPVHFSWRNQLEISCLFPYPFPFLFFSHWKTGRSENQAFLLGLCRLYVCQSMALLCLWILFWCPCRIT